MSTFSCENIHFRLGLQNDEGGASVCTRSGGSSIGDDGNDDDDDGGASDATVLDDKTISDGERSST